MRNEPGECRQWDEPGYSRQMAPPLGDANTFIVEELPNDRGGANDSSGQQGEPGR
jgi:hypothetical protein